MMKRTLAILLALLCCLTGTAQAQEVARGRYVQETLELPQEINGVYGMGLDEQGQIALAVDLGNQVLGRATLGPKGQWTVAAMPWWDELTAAFGETSVFAAALKGEDIYLAIYLPQEEGRYPYQVIRGGRETMTPVDNAEMLADLPGVAALAADGDVVLAKDYHPGAYSYDSRTGHRIAGYPQVSYAQGGALWMDQGRLYTLDEERQSALVLDVQTGEVIFEMADAPLGDDCAVYSDGESFYLLNKGGVYRIALGGSMWEQLVDGSLTDLRQTITYARALCVVDDELFALVGDNEQSKLLRFHYDPDVTTMPTKTLSVYTLNTSRLAEQAAGAFQLSNPDYRVNVTVLLSGDAGATRADVISALNVELLSGKGPDVLVLDGLPVNAYLEKGVLADLSQVVKPMMESGELFENLFVPFFDGEQVYAVPTRAALPVAMGQCGFEGWQQMLEAIEAGLAIPPRTRKGYVETFLPTCFGAWFEEDGTLKEQSLADFLAGMERIYGACGQDGNEYMKKIEDYALFYQQGAAETGRVMIPMNGYLGNAIDLLGLTKGRYAMMPTMLEGLAQSMTELSQMEEMNGGIALLPGQAGRVCAVAGLAGVNARSPQAEAAKAFVATMLSQPVQDGDLYDGAMAVNRRSLEKLRDRKDSNFMLGGLVDDPETGETVSLTGRWPNAQTRQRVYELMNEADAVYAPDQTLLELVREALHPFCQGEMAPEEAAKAVAAKLRAYLAE